MRRSWHCILAVALHTFALGGNDYVGHVGRSNLLGVFVCLRYSRSLMVFATSAYICAYTEARGRDLHGLGARSHARIKNWKLDGGTYRLVTSCKVTRTDTHACLINLDHTVNPFASFLQTKDIRGAVRPKSPAARQCQAQKSLPQIGGVELLSTVHQKSRLKFSRFLSELSWELFVP